MKLLSEIGHWENDNEWQQRGNDRSTRDSATELWSNGVEGWTLETEVKMSGRLSVKQARVL